MLSDRERLLGLSATIIRHFQIENEPITDDMLLIMWKQIDEVRKTQFINISFTELFDMIKDLNKDIKMHCKFGSHTNWNREEVEKFYVEDFNEFLDYRERKKGESINE